MIGIDALIEIWCKDNLFVHCGNKKTRKPVKIDVNEGQKRQKLRKASTQQSDFLQKMFYIGSNDDIYSLIKNPQRPKNNHVCWQKSKKNAFVKLFQTLAGLCF